MKIFPLACIVFGIYILYRKQKECLSDEIYRRVYMLAGIFSIIHGCAGVLMHVFLRTVMFEHGLYNLYHFARGAIGGVWFGLAIVFALIDTKLRREEKKNGLKPE